MAESIVSSTGRVSSIDYGENLLKSSLIDPSRQPYVLARIALTEREGYIYAGSNKISEALHALHDANKQRVLEPPLSEPLAGEIEHFLADERGQSRHNFAAAVLLAIAIDEGTRPNG